MLKKPLNIFKYISLFWIIVLCFNNSVYANSKYASIIIEEHSGKILYSRSANESRYPASMTKVMTLYIIFDEIKKGKLNYNSKIIFQIELLDNNLQN